MMLTLLIQSLEQIYNGRVGNCAAFGAFIQLEGLKRQVYVERLHLDFSLLGLDLINNGRIQLGDFRLLP